MRLLEIWVATPLAQAVGWTLLHSLWQGAIVAAALAAALWATRSARARYAAACVAMLLMLGGIAVTLVHLTPEGVHGLRTPGTTAFPVWNVPSDMDASGPSNPGLAAVVPWLAPFWILGVWIFALRQVAGWITVCRLRRRGVCCAPERWQKELARLGARLRLSRPVLLLESCLADVPMVVGHIRPAILMPIGLLVGLPPVQIEAILLHELAHIRRYDYLVNVLQRSVECLLFYHPAVWWISRVIRAERENCCDDVVVAGSGKIQEYAEALVALEQNRRSGREAVPAASGGSLMKRIRRLLHPQGANSFWTPFFAALVLIATGVVAFAIWPSKPQQISAAQRKVEQAEASPYERWLSQEVPYIITDQERTAFKNLTTDEERDTFIQQFWERRNPHPGNPKNEFKAEHYRRIAYANQHFASDRPGWETDRGYTYIAYGPPDEIAMNWYGPKPGPHVPYGIQVWTYRHVKGVGDNLSVQFMDTTGKGDYELPTDPNQQVRAPQRRATGATLAPTAKALPQQSSAAPPRQAAHAEISPYDRWLSEEVPYIITDQERTAFQKLATDEEREMFIQQFWERRNPHPGGSQNAFKEEHYRRIAYANEHFATGRPGWRTDRGRLYIIYGPPDEIESHPKPYPSEQWKYRSIEGLGNNVIFTFKDRTGKGDFILESPPWKTPAKKNSVS